jgi:Holliday junction DNA helicase RuvB
MNGTETIERKTMDNEENSYCPVIDLVTFNADENLRPVIIDSVIGQRDTCKKLEFFVSSHSDETPFPSMLLTGSQGLGKSFLSQKIAEALGREYIEINCSSCVTTEDFIEGVLMGKVNGNTPKTILLDESHELSSDVTTVLLSLLNPNESNANTFEYKGIKLCYDMSKVNIIFATTDAHRMFLPLVNRCEVMYLSPYSNEDLFKMIELYTPGIDFTCDKESISYACRGRGRDAFKLSQNILRYCNRESTNEFSEADWNDFQDIFGIYPMGLNQAEISIMNLLTETMHLSCRNIAIKLGVNEKNVESELEIRLKELGLIECTAKGRSLSNKGREYMNNLNNMSV